MNYGDYLASAAVGLARAHAALRGPAPADPAARVSVVLPRARLYRSLAWQAAIVGRIPSLESSAADGARPFRRRSGLVPGPVTDLVLALRQAAATTAMTTHREPDRIDLPATTGPVATALYDAAHAIEAAGEILSSHTGIETGGIRRPFTTEGLAVLVGAGHDDNFASLAELATAAGSLDVRLGRWLWPEHAPSPWQPLLAAAEEDACRVRCGALRYVAPAAAADGRGDQAPMLGMGAVPPIDDPMRWASLANHGECVQALDATRAWLTIHSDQITLGQITAAARAALAITRYVEHVHLRTVNSGHAASVPAFAAAARSWRHVVRAAADLRDPQTGIGAGQITPVVALTSLSRWLQNRLRPEGQWLDDTAWATDHVQRVGWRSTAGSLMARMPDLADLLQMGTAQAQARGAVLALTGGLCQRPGQLVRIPEWGPVPRNHESFRAVTDALRAAAATAREAATAVGVECRPGLAEARTATAPARISPARLVRQWYPASSGVSEPNQAPNPCQPAALRNLPPTSPRQAPGR
ncbi:MAG: hypothetical protein HKP61_15125 [Dactylosporangium sp.]|nr:hypothetical protein [Dactylosporangium sp.]NNJ62243.1 hypothetical protein [Dactylosporangium sp.]